MERVDILVITEIMIMMMITGITMITIRMMNDDIIDSNSDNNDVTGIVLNIRIKNNTNVNSDETLSVDNDNDTDSSTSDDCNNDDDN